MPTPSSSPWTPAPTSAQLALETGWAHVFRLRLDVSPECAARLRPLLSPDEQSRASRYHFAADRLHFTAAHGQLRQILAAYLRCAPAELAFEQNPYGKPALVGGPALQFNLSHSRGLGLLAVTAAQTVGVDVEGLRPDLERENIARRFFAPAEVERLLALPAGQQIEAFYACWTRKEAYMKARGLGLSIPLDGFQVTLAPGEAVRLLHTEPGSPPPAAWSLAAFDPGPGFAAALAVLGELRGVRCWDWPLRELVLPLMPSAPEQSGLLRRHLPQHLRMRIAVHAALFQGVYLPARPKQALQVRPAKEAFVHPLHHVGVWLHRREAFRAVVDILSSS